MRARGPPALRIRAGDGPRRGEAVLEGVDEQQPGPNALAVQQVEERLPVAELVKEARPGPCPDGDAGFRLGKLEEREDPFRPPLPSSPLGLQVLPSSPRWLSASTISHSPPRRPRPGRWRPRRAGCPFAASRARPPTTSNRSVWGFTTRCRGLRSATPGSDLGFEPVGIRHGDLRRLPEYLLGLPPPLRCRTDEPLQFV